MQADPTGSDDDQAIGLVAEIEAWLADSDWLPRIVKAALPAQRRGFHWGATIAEPWKHEVLFSHREEYGPDEAVQELRDLMSGGWKDRSTRTTIADVTPGQLRWIAQEHRAAVEKLLDDAEMLEGVADAIEAGTDFGRQLLAQMEGVGRQVAEKKAAADRDYAVACSEGGVLKWAALDSELQWTLKRAGLLTVDQVRDAMREGRLHSVEGIGPARFAKVAKALAGAQ
jgi:hypothetical protein